MSIKSSIRIAESSSRTVSTTFIVDDNNLSNGTFYISPTAGASGSDTLTVTIAGYDETSGLYVTILESAAITSNNVVTLNVGGYTPAATNLAAEAFLPKKFAVIVVKNNATAITYSIGANLSD